MTKTIIPLAIIAMLPFTANAAQTIVTTQTPAAVGANGTVAQAATSGPYQTATIGEHDDEHIATTAYVKGAYNDAIAAVNRVNDTLDYKQNAFQDREGDPIDTVVLSGWRFTENLGDLYNPDITQSQKNDILLGLQRQLVSADEIAEALIETRRHMKQVDIQAPLTTTVNNQSQNISSTVAQTVDTTTPSATTLVSEAGVANYVNAQRVEIYTTWDDDTEKQQVAFVTAQ